MQNRPGFHVVACCNGSSPPAAVLAARPVLACPDTAGANKNSAAVNAGTNSKNSSFPALRQTDAGLLNVG